MKNIFTIKQATKRAIINKVLSWTKRYRSKLKIASAASMLRSNVPNIKRPSAFMVVF